jgi:DNA-binding FrmR family transcriptional regulator
MSHTIQDKKKLLDRVSRMRGQLEAIEHYSKSPVAGAP